MAGYRESAEMDVNCSTGPSRRLNPLSTKALIQCPNGPVCHWAHYTSLHLLLLSHPATVSLPAVSSTPISISRFQGWCAHSSFLCASITLAYSCCLYCVLHCAALRWCYSSVLLLYQISSNLMLYHGRS